MPGDGIGKEVIPVAVAVLRAVLPDLDVVEMEAGWEAFEKYGASVPSETLSAIRDYGAGLFGAVQSPSYKVAGYRSAILTMRQELDLYANIRPVQSLPNVSPRQDVDMIIVRENSEGLYISDEESDGETAIARRRITKKGSVRIARKAVAVMEKFGRNRLTIVHKANVLPLTDGLFRDSVRSQIPAHITIDELLVDVAALKMVSAPNIFDTLVTTNLFGDILSDAAAHWGGGLGLAPSLNWGDTIAVAEPVHGSAPDIAGTGQANPLAAVLSAAMLLDYVWDRADLAKRIRAAVTTVLAAPLSVENRTKQTEYRLLNLLS
jgi:homoisocitrate dehydrogenase